eukprot:2965091-Pleurochrysis_carterae.AAC.1
MRGTHAPYASSCVVARVWRPDFEHTRAWACARAREREARPRLDVLRVLLRNAQRPLRRLQPRRQKLVAQSMQVHAAHRGRTYVTTGSN